MHKDKFIKWTQNDKNITTTLGHSSLQGMGQMHHTHLKTNTTNTCKEKKKDTNIYQHITICKSVLVCTCTSTQNQKGIQNTGPRRCKWIQTNQTTHFKDSKLVFICKEKQKSLCMNSKEKKSNDSHSPYGTSWQPVISKCFIHIKIWEGKNQSIPFSEVPVIGLVHRQHFLANSSPKQSPQ